MSEEEAVKVFLRNTLLAVIGFIVVVQLLGYIFDEWERRRRK